MEKFDILPRRIDGHTVDFQSRDVGTVRMRDDGTASWRDWDADENQWENVPIEPVAVVAVAQAVLETRGLYDWRLDRLRESGTLDELAPLEASPKSEVKPYQEPRPPTELVVQGVAFTGHEHIVRLRDDKSAASFRALSASETEWQSFDLSAQVFQAVIGRSIWLVYAAPKVEQLFNELVDKLHQTEG